MVAVSLNILGAILYIFPARGTEILSSVRNAKSHETGVQYSQKGYKMDLTCCLLFRATTSARSQEMTSYALYFFELHLPEVYGLHFYCRF